MGILHIGHGRSIVFPVLFRQSTPQIVDLSSQDTKGKTLKLVSLVRRVKWRKVLYTTGIALGVALLAQQLWRGYRAFQEAQACVLHPTFLLATLGIYIVAYFIQMAAWALIMRSLQAPLSVGAVTQGYALSFLP